MTEQVQDVQETQEQKPVILNFQMSLENINALIGFLAKQPYENVSGFINIIRSQAVQQLQQLAEENKESTEENKEEPTIQ